MSDNFPIPINNETDLVFYENYLNKEFENDISLTIHKTKTLKNLLESYIGFFIKAEVCVGNRLEVRVGKLLEIGQDYLCLSSSSNKCKTIIDIKSVRFFTIPQNNYKNLY